MSSYAYNIPGTTNNFPGFPGCYLLSNPNTDNTYTLYPIFKSMPDLTTGVSNLNNTTEKLLVLPGFKVEAFYGSYGPTPDISCNNSGGTNFIETNVDNNNVSSLKLYFGSNTTIWTQL